MKYADVIIDISIENLDKTYQYKIPDELQQSVHIGVPVYVPFGKGNRVIQGFVIIMSNIAKFEEKKMKNLPQIVEKGQAIENQLIKLAAFINE